MPQIKVLLIPVRGELEIHEIDPDRVQDLQALVGGYFKVVRMSRAPKMLMWVVEDAESRMTDSPPVNLRASLLGDLPLNGPAVISGQSADNIAGVPDEILAALVNKS